MAASPFCNTFKSNIKITVLSVLVIVVTIVVAGGTALAAHYDDSGNRRVLKSASEFDYPPFALVRPDGSADGFSVELLRAVASAVNLEVDISVGPWHEIKDQLAKGSLDVLPLVAYSAERSGVYDFTVPYLEMRGTIFIRKGEKSILSVDDLKTKEVLVMRADSSYEYAVREKIARKLILTESYEEAMKLLAAGKYDAVLCHYVMGLQLLKKLGITNVVSVSLGQKSSLKPMGEQEAPYGQSFSIAVRRGDKELLSLLNEGLAIVYANGTYERLYNKWFSLILPSPPVSFMLVLTYALYIVIPFFFILGILGLWLLDKKVKEKTLSLQNETKEKIKAQAKFRSFMMSANDGFVLFDKELNLSEINEKALDMHLMGVGRGDLNGKNILDISPNLEESGRYEKYLEVLSTGRSITFDEFTLGDPFDDRYMSLKAFKVDDGLGLIFSDVTEHKKTKEALAESEERFRSMMHQSPAVIELYDIDGLQVNVNKAYETLWGFPASHTVGSFNVLQSKEVEETGLMEYVKKAYGGEAVTVPPYEFDSRGESEGGGAGRKRWLSTRIYPLKDTAGNVKNIVITHEDISEVIYAEEEKAKLESRLQQAQKMEAIGTLAGGIAHDFNNILSAILGYADMAREDSAKDSSVAKDLDKVIEAGYRARDLVRQILAFSRQANTERILFQPASIVKEAMKMLRPTLPTSIEIFQDISSTTGLIFADPTQLNQILMNLCTNAFHAMEDGGGRLEILLKEVELCDEDLIHESAVDAGRFVQLSVCDSGPGISPEIKPKIFNPYFTTKETGRGTGMGLAIVHGIVKSYGGFISLYSELGEGTSFKVFLPVVEQGVQPEEQVVESVPLGSERILFVDDEHILADMGKDMLERLGYEVTVKTISYEALELFQAQPDMFDMVITDQTMPGITGADLAERMLEIRPDIPIILCTGYSAVVSEEKAKSIGIKEFTLKPLSKNSIARLIRKVLDA